MRPSRIPAKAASLSLARSTGCHAMTPGSPAATVCCSYHPCRRRDRAEARDIAGHCGEN